MQERKNNSFYYRDNSTMLSIKNARFNSNLEFCIKNLSKTSLIKVLTYHHTNDKLIIYVEKQKHLFRTIKIKLKSDKITNATIDINYPNSLISLKYENISPTNGLFKIIFLNSEKTTTQISQQILFNNQNPLTFLDFDNTIIQIKNIIFKHPKDDELFTLTPIINKLSNITKLNLILTTEEQEIINHSIYEKTLSLKK